MIAWLPTRKYWLVVTPAERRFLARWFVTCIEKELT